MVTPGRGRLTTFPWDYLENAEFVAQMRHLVYNPLPPYPERLDVRDWVAPDRMPIEKARDQLDFLQVPETSHLGDVFTRRVINNLFTYMHRNSWSGLTRTEMDLQIKTIFNWRHGDVDNPGVPATRRTAADIWVTPSPIIDLTPLYVQHIATWLRWQFPYLEGEVDCVDGDPDEGVRPRIVVYLSTVTQPEVRIDHAVSYFVPRYVETTLVS